MKFKLFAIVLIAVAVVFTYVYKPAILNQFLTDNHLVNNIDTRSDRSHKVTQKDNDVLPSNAPLAAKKLHRLMDDPLLLPESDTSLEARLEQLNKDIDDIDRNLLAKGIQLQEKPAVSTEDRELENRLSRIKNHLQGSMP